MTFRRILFPVDFSERSRAVAPFVLSMAQRYSANVVLMHVIEPPPPLYGGIDTVYPVTVDYTESQRALLRDLDEFGATELPKVEVSAIVDLGEPAYAITDYARLNGIDLIAMATHGYGAFRRALLGSVASKVLHDVKIPVWTSAHAPEPSHRAHPQPRHILAAIDLDKGARETLEAAVAIAKDTGATLDIVTAVAEGIIGPAMADAQLEDLLKAGARELVAKLQFEAGTDLGTVIEMGSPAGVLRTAALNKRADLIVAGHGGAHTALGRLLADIDAIVREAPCPVLSL